MDATFSDPKRGALLIFATAILAFFVVGCLRLAGTLEGLELRHHDWVSARSAQTGIAKDVVLVTVEEQDLAHWGWPLPDHKIAEILVAIGTAEPAAIGLDIYRDTPVGSGAEELARAFETTGAIGITKLGPQGGFTVKPPEILQNNGNFGFSDIPVDQDGIVRRALLLVNTGAENHLSFAMKLALRKSGQTGIKASAEDPSVMMLGNATLPPIGPDFGGYLSVDSAGYQIPLRFEHALPVAQSIPARDVLTSVPQDALRDKVVIIGLNSQSIKDYFRTPLNIGAVSRFTYGSQVQASVVQHLLNVAQAESTMLRDSAVPVQFGLMLFAALAGAFLGFMSRAGVTLIILFPITLVTGFLVLNFALGRGLWLPAVPSLLALTLGFLLCFGALAVGARRQRKIMATLFSDHLSPDLAAQIWENRALFMTGGKPRPQKLDATVIFLDIAGSTAIGGTAEPDAYVAWISRILDALSDVARSHGGFIEKFTGDGLLIAFGAPLQRTRPDEIQADALAACRCAQALGAKVTKLNAAPEKHPPYRVRIGVHSGMVYGGVLGNRGALQYNLVGDTVNVAARIESFGKTLQDRQKENALICLSDITLERSGTAVTAHPVGTLVHDDGATQIEVFEMRACL